jgi:hypothetical protein
MFFTRFLPTVACSLLLCSCADQGLYPLSGDAGRGAFPQDSGAYPSTATPPRYRPPQPGNDDADHLTKEYQNGYDIGQRDASVGYPRDYRRAFERFGGGYESTFQEGYMDGYDGRGMQH